jgi:ABC-2 type transport system permease protein
VNNSNWLIRREFWENRAIWMIPAVFGGLLLLAALFTQVRIPHLSSQLESEEAASAFLVVVGAMFYLVMALYSAWYLLDCLYADRKDRSILFWKSLPVSDAATVLCKLLIGMIIIPLVYFVAADATALIAAFILSIRARASIGSSLWNGSVWLQIQVLWMYVIVTTAVWYLPIAGWLMLLSAWAKRAVILWAILPPILLNIFERLFFGTHMVSQIINRRLTALPLVSFNGLGNNFSWTHEGGVADNAGSQVPSVWSLINPSGFFSSPETWIGVAVGIALIVVAIQLRMRRSEI